MTSFAVSIPNLPQLRAALADSPAIAAADKPGEAAKRFIRLYRVALRALLASGCAAVDDKHSALAIAGLVRCEVETPIGHFLGRARALHRRRPVRRNRIVEEAEHRSCLLYTSPSPRDS